MGCASSSDDNDVPENILADASATLTGINAVFAGCQNEKWDVTNVRGKDAKPPSLTKYSLSSPVGVLTALRQPETRYI